MARICRIHVSDLRNVSIPSLSALGQAALGTLVFGSI
jgi:hypothetical protein